MNMAMRIMMILGLVNIERRAQVVCAMHVQSICILTYSIETLLHTDLNEDDDFGVGLILNAEHKWCVQCMCKAFASLHTVLKHYFIRISMRMMILGLG